MRCKCCVPKNRKKTTRNLQQHLLRQLDDPRRRNDTVSMDSQQTRLLYLLHHETADFVVVGRFAPRTADSNDLLTTRTAAYILCTQVEECTHITVITVYFVMQRRCLY